MNQVEVVCREIGELKQMVQQFMKISTKNNKNGDNRRSVKGFSLNESSGFHHPKETRVPVLNL